MCWQCDNPDKTLDDYLAILRSTILSHGWAVQYVEHPRAPYAYTIGLHPHGLSELLVTGVSAYHATWVLNTVARRAVAGKELVAGHQWWLPAGARLELVEVSEPSAHMDMAIALEGPGVRAIQLVWADDRRRWPWAPDFDGGGRIQPVLGMRATRSG